VSVTAISIVCPYDRENTPEYKQRKLRVAEISTNGRGDKYLNPAKQSGNYVRPKSLNSQNPLRFLSFPQKAEFISLNMTVWVLV
jgi:hypothetical protein